MSAPFDPFSPRALAILRQSLLRRLADHPVPTSPPEVRHVDGEPYCFVAGREVHATRIQSNFTHVITSPDSKLESVLGAFERGYNLRWSRKAGEKEAATAHPAVQAAINAARRHGVYRPR